MRVLVHAPGDERFAAGLRTRLHQPEAEGGAGLDRLIGDGDGQRTAFTLYTEHLASLFVPADDPVLPRSEFPVIEFLRAVSRWPRGPRMGAAVFASGGFDRIAVMAGSAGEAELGARMIGGTDGALVMRAASDVIWDRLSEASRRARTLLGQGRIHAAAIALRGRGRIAGPVNPDLLIRFGVSAFR